MSTSAEGVGGGGESVVVVVMGECCYVPFPHSILFIEFYRLVGKRGGRAPRRRNKANMCADCPSLYMHYEVNAEGYTITRL